MSSSALRVVRTKAFQLTGLPVGLVLVIALCLFILSGMKAGYSTLLGGATWLLPSFYFAHQVFSKIGTAKTILWMFYRAEITKLLLSAVLFILICRFFSVNMLIFLLGYMAAQCMFWLAPVLMTRTMQR